MGIIKRVFLINNIIKVRKERKNHSEIKDSKQKNDMIKISPSISEITIKIIHRYWKTNYILKIPSLMLKQETLKANSVRKVKNKMQKK